MDYFEGLDHVVHPIVLVVDAEVVVAIVVVVVVDVEVVVAVNFEKSPNLPNEIGDL